MSARKRKTKRFVLDVSFVRDISVFVQSDFYNVNCPDSDDNYLYDISLSTNAKLIVTGDKALLTWKETPIETISLADFKNIF